MSKWPTVTLGDVAAIDRASVQPNDIEAGTMYLGLEDIESWTGRLNPKPVDAGFLASSKFRFTRQHVLYGKLRPYLAKIACPDVAGVCSTDILPILPGPKIDRQYLFQFLRRPKVVAYAGAQAGGANLPRLSPNALAAFELPLPPLADQRRIATILQATDSLRAKRRATLALLDSLTSAVFLEMFGDPVTNPKRWSDGKLGSQLTFQQYGPRFFNEAYSDDGIRILRITDLNDAGVFDFESMPRMTLALEDQEKYLLQTDDVVFARSGATVGKVGLIGPEDPPCIAGAYFIVMRFSPSVLPIYVRAVLRSPSVRELVTQRSRQAAQQNFSGPGLRALPLPVPPIGLQKDYAALINTAAGMGRTLRVSLSELDALFASLQHQAFNGEL